MTRDTTRLKAQSLTYVNAQPNLCIMVLAATHDDGRCNPGDHPVHGLENDRFE